MCDKNVDWCTVVPGWASSHFSWSLLWHSCCFRSIYKFQSSWTVKAKKYHLSVYTKYTVSWLSAQEPQKRCICWWAQRGRCRRVSWQVSGYDEAIVWYLPPPPPSDEMAPIPPDDAEHRKKLSWWVHLQYKWGSALGMGGWRWWCDSTENKRCRNYDLWLCWSTLFSYQSFTASKTPLRGFGNRQRSTRGHTLTLW